MANVGAVFPLFYRVQADTSAFPQFQLAADRAMQGVQRGAQRTSTALSEAARNASQFIATATGRFSGLSLQLQQSAGLVERLGNLMGGALAAFGGGVALIAATTNLQNYQNLLKAATGSQAEFNAASAATIKIANDTRSELSEVIRFYARLTQASDAYGFSQQRVNQLTTTALKSIQLSGASLQEATAAAQQFSQAIASGRLNGDEFRSLAENASRLTRVIAEGLVRTGDIAGFDGTIGQLRQLAEEGELTTERVARAIEAMGTTVDEEFARMPPTISQSMTLIRNSFSAAAVNFENATGVLGALASGIKFVADNMSGVAALALAVGAVVGGRLAGNFLIAKGGADALTGSVLRQTGVMTAAQAAVRTLNAAIVSYGIASAAAGPRVAIMTTATSVMASVVAGARTALAGLIAFLGGPWGAAITAATLGLVYFTTRTTDAERAQSSLTTALDRVNSVIDQQTLKLREGTSEWEKYRAAQAAGIAGANAQTILDEARKQLTGRVRQFAGDTGALGLPSSGLEQRRGSEDQFMRDASRIAAAARDGKLNRNQAAFELRALTLVGADDKKVEQRRRIVQDLTDDLNKYFDALDQVAEVEKKTTPFRDVKPPSPIATLDEARRFLRSQERPATPKTIANAPLTKEQEAAAIAARAAMSDMDRAQAQFKAQMAELKKIKKDISQEEYITRAAEIERTYRSQTEAIKAAGAARRQAATQGRQQERQEAREAKRYSEETRRLLDDLMPYQSALRDWEADLARVNAEYKSGALSVGNYARALEALENRRPENPQTEIRGITTIEDVQRQLESRIGDIFEPSGKVGAKTEAYWDRFETRGLFAIQSLADSLGEGFGRSFSKIAEAFGVMNGQQGYGVLGLAQFLLRGKNERTTRNPKTGEVVIEDALTDFQKGMKDAFKGVTDILGEAFRPLRKALGDLAKKLFPNTNLAKKAGEAFAGAQIGDNIASLSKALGLGGSRTGARIGGAIGQLSGIPGGALIGSVIGSTIGAAVRKTAKSVVDLTTGDRGFVDVGGGRKIGKGNIGDAKQLGGGVGDSLERIAQQFGASLASNFTIGQVGKRKDEFFFDPTPNKGKKFGNDKDTQKFATAEEAATAAIKSAIDRGILVGLKAGTQRLLQGAKDLERALNDALKFESVFTRLREFTDPVGAALDKLNKEFAELKIIFGEAGASAEEYAQLEKLYTIERQRAVDSAGQQVSQLKEFLDSLTKGSDSPLSLTQRRSNVLADFDKFVADINAGKTINQEKFTNTAGQLLEIESGLFGRTQGFFDRFNQITSLTQKAIDQMISPNPIGETVANPFAPSAGAPSETASVQSAIDNQTNVLGKKTDQMIDYLKVIASNVLGSSAGARVGGGIEFDFAQAGMRSF